MKLVQERIVGKLQEFPHDQFQVDELRWSGIFKHFAAELQDLTIYWKDGVLLLLKNDKTVFVSHFESWTLHKIEKGAHVDDFVFSVESKSSLIVRFNSFLLQTWVF